MIGKLNPAEMWGFLFPDLKSTEACIYAGFFMDATMPPPPILEPIPQDLSATGMLSLKTVSTLMVTLCSIFVAIFSMYVWADNTHVTLRSMTQANADAISKLTQTLEQERQIAELQAEIKRLKYEKGMQ